MVRAGRLGMGVRHYTELVAWQLADELRRNVVAISARPTVAADFRFCAQIREAAASVPRNIAEGFGRYVLGEFAQFLRYARGSLYETQECLRDGLDRGHINRAEYDELMVLSTRAAAAVTRLLRSIACFPPTARPPSRPKLPRR
jgi:four helix bundle protein